MRIPNKTFTYTSSKFFFKYYRSFSTIKEDSKFLWERNTTVPIFYVNKAFWIHKGRNFRKKVFEYYHLSVPAGAFAFTRKPFTPPVKRKDLKKKKRIG